MFNMQSTYLLKMTVCLSLQLSSVHLWGSAWVSSTEPHITTFVFIVGICSGKSFALYTFKCEYPDTLLNLHYLAKQSGPDKRGLTVVCGVFAYYSRLAW